MPQPHYPLRGIPITGQRPSTLPLPPALQHLGWVNSGYLSGEAKPPFGDDRPVHGHDSFHKGGLCCHFHNCYFQYHGMTRVYWNQESHVVDGRQNQELVPFYAGAGGLAKKDRSALSDRFDNERPRHDRIVGEMAKELNLVTRDVLEAFDSLAGLDLQYPVDHEQGESLPKVGLDFFKGHCHESISS